MLTCLHVLSMYINTYLLDVREIVSNYTNTFKSEHSLKLDSQPFYKHPNVKWREGNCSERGVRSVNEDRIVAITDMSFDTEFQLCSIKYHGENRTEKLSDYTTAYYAIYDGHCGSHASSHAQQVLHKAIYRYVECLHMVFVT